MAVGEWWPLIQPPPPSQSNSQIPTSALLVAAGPHPIPCIWIWVGPCPLFLRSQTTSTLSLCRAGLESNHAPSFSVGTSHFPPFLMGLGHNTFPCGAELQLGCSSPACLCMAGQCPPCPPWCLIGTTSRIWPMDEQGTAHLSCGGEGESTTGLEQLKRLKSEPK